MHLNPKFLMEKAGVTIPLIGFYDTPDPSAFEPTVKPIEGRWACLFMFYKNWLKGKTLHLTKENYGCGLLAPLVDDLEGSRAIIGATDIAMRKFLPSNIMAFTVTKPMYKQLCALDEDSFLEKPFWQDLKKARRQP